MAQPAPGWQGKAEALLPHMHNFTSLTTFDVFTFIGTRARGPPVFLSSGSLWDNSARAAALCDEGAALGDFPWGEELKGPSKPQTGLPNLPT